MSRREPTLKFPIGKNSGYPILGDLARARSQRARNDQPIGSDAALKRSYISDVYLQSFNRN
ncbi:MAG: hypothetical protein KDB71_15210, partial [Mycobacterium sp.]|nr:hypothetical protein [Mycobacterium sp.]